MSSSYVELSSLIAFLDLNEVACLCDIIIYSVRNYTLCNGSVITRTGPELGGSIHHSHVCIALKIDSGIRVKINSMQHRNFL